MAPAPPGETPATAEGAELVVELDTKESSRETVTKNAIGCREPYEAVPKASGVPSEKRLKENT